MVNEKILEIITAQFKAGQVGVADVMQQKQLIERNNGELIILKVRLYRPFSVEHFIAALPTTTKKIAVLDRTKEPGAIAEPLHMDIVHALAEARTLGTNPFATDPVVVGGRYGLSSKEFNDGMVKAIFDNLAQDQPKNHFTVGIVDDAETDDSSTLGRLLRLLAATICGLAANRAS